MHHRVQSPNSKKQTNDWAQPIADTCEFSSRVYYLAVFPAWSTAISYADSVGWRGIIEADAVCRRTHHVRHSIQTATPPA